jgi:hypothetical protein
MTLSRLMPPALLLVAGVVLATPGEGGAQPAAPPPPPAPPQAPQAAPAAAPDPELERAIRARLFSGPLTPGQEPDPESTEWEQARAKGTHPTCGDVGPLRYLSSRVDLDGEGTPETLALVVGSYACGSGGCTLLIFRDTPGGLEPIAESGLFQSPLRRLERRSGGWAELTMPATSDGVNSGVMELRFEGGSYRFTRAATPPEPAADPGGSAVLLELPPVPFESLGLPLPCNGSVQRAFRHTGR